MNENLQIVFGLLGGLSLFLFGMNNMSDALQKSAGDKMRKVLGFLTKNPLMGALAGALVTAILQSSSATTVMVIGFVSAGLMTLPQAISVIFGANVGTTMTAQLIAFKLSDYIFVIIFVGFIIQFLAKKEQIKSIGMVILSFGILFEGIEIMSSSMAPLAQSAIFTELMSQVKNIPILGVLLGLCMTLLVQSSSATIAVLQSFASTPAADGVSSIIGLAGAIPILMGDNIGTTVTALIASVGQSKDAKKTAIAHSVFNISGAIGLSLILPLFTKLIIFISPKGNEIDVISRQIANAHTVFNILCTLIWLPLIPLMVKLVNFIIRDKKAPKAIPGIAAEKEAAHTTEIQPRFLDDAVIGQPVAALFLISQEIEHLSGVVKRMMKRAQKQAVGLNEKNSMMVTENPEESFDYLYSSTKQLVSYIAGYITKLFSSGNLTEYQAEQASGLLSVVNDIDRITDRTAEIMHSIAKLNETGHKMSEDALDELKSCFQASRRLFDKTIHAIMDGDPNGLVRIEKDRNKMRKAQKQFGKDHLKRVRDNKCDAKVTPLFTSILYSFDRLVDNCAGIAEEAMDHTELLTLNGNSNYQS